MNEILLYFAYKYKGNWNNIYKAIKNKEIINDENYNLVLEEIKKDNPEFFTILEEKYPKQLIASNKPPFVLFYKGNINILKEAKECIYLTGSYETKSIIEYVNNLKNNKNITIINSFWPGLEQTILHSILKNNFKAIIILPCGINWAIKHLDLNKFNHPNCLFLSEFPNEYHITRTAYATRNRINASMCTKMILLSSLEKKYNTLINEFLDQGKDIQCLLFKDHDLNDGNIDLINEGAELISENKEIF
ncbi:DNA-processing protein DprA [Metamycoplasma alkalescens]|uniref:DNA processing protein n=2 Tax=Metamycoplasma alkalescens TaxID=45363 RepID=A0A318U6W9_9BACT|nr:DNA-processing protein DprA [Metamycoplasma alkalescens]PYF43687.1 DNA processing protein [Metamycoplasma alkalescens]